MWASHVVVAGALLPLNLVVTLNPVTLVGLGIAGFVSWPLAAILAAAVLAGAGATCRASECVSTCERPFQMMR
ncbi:MAG: hypothetical protein WKF83_11470 [Nocardioidaceae bacterium]